MTREDTAFVAIQHVNVNRLEAGIDYQPTTLEKKKLWDVAKSAMADRVFARGLLVHMLDTIFEPEMSDDSIGLRSYEEAGQSILPTMAKIQGIRVIPNPAIDEITVITEHDVNLKAPFRYVVCTPQGMVVSSDNEVADNFVINISRYIRGLYLINIVDVNGVTRSIRFIKG